MRARPEMRNPAVLAAGPTQRSRLWVLGAKPQPPQGGRRLMSFDVAPAHAARNTGRRPRPAIRAPPPSRRG